MKKHAVHFQYGDNETTERVSLFEHYVDAMGFMDTLSKIPGRKCRYIRLFDPIGDVAAFHKKFTINYGGAPRALSQEILNFRMRFLRQETNEYEDHSQNSTFEQEEGVTDQGNLTHELAESLDALVDLMYVLIGTSHLHGFDKVFAEAWDRVHEANMKKVLVDNPANADEKFKLKISKPKDWEPPKLDDLVEANAHVFKGPSE